MAAGELLLQQERLKLAVTLVKNDLFGIRENEEDYITLKSGRRSPHYLDIRAGLSNYAIRRTISGAMVNLARGYTTRPDLDPDYVVGAPEAMTSYAASIADGLGRGLLQPRVALNKTSGNKTPILGRYVAGEVVEAFDDVVTDGQTKIDTISSLRAAGLEVSDYRVVLDREEGGAPQVYQETGVEITAALGVASMVRMLTAEGIFSQTQHDNVARYLEVYGDPHAQELMNTAL